MSLTDQNKANLCDVDHFDDGGLKRGLKNRHVQLIALGGIIGSCFFLGTGQVVQAVGPAAFLAYVLGGIIIYLVMLCLGELAVAIPIAGSFVTYAADFISPTWACGVGWTYWLSWVTYVPCECTAAGIIMNYFFPTVNQYIWAVALGVIITFINISKVKAFGEVEFWLALCKIAGLVFFSIIAVFIIFGLIHGDTPSHGFIGTSILLSNGGLFPLGGFVVLTEMVMLLVNFQGSEIIGLSAGECVDPSKTIPIAIRNVTFRIVCLYLIPVFLLVMILPWADASVDQCVFATALDKYGLHWAGGLFSIIALTAAMSCANSGTYGAVRSLWALAREGMAPRFIAKLNKHAVPANAAYVTIAGAWIFLLASYFFSASEAFVYLLSIAGFTGEMCWISICWSQYNFRRRLHKAGYTDGALRYKSPWFPFVAQAGIWLQVASLLFCLFNEDLRPAFYFGVPSLIIPMVIYKLSGVNRQKLIDQQDRIRFDDVFPPKTGVGAGPNVSL
jgi:amino acid transporter, AAT family